MSKYEHVCGPGCNHGPATPEAEAEVREEFKVARRSFLRDAFAVGGATVSASALNVAMTPSAFAQSAKPGSGMASHYYIPAVGEHGAVGLLQQVGQAAWSRWSRATS